MALDQALDAETVIDLDRYPIVRMDDPRRAALVERCRRDLTEGALCSVPGFIRPEAVTRMAAELAPHYGKACYQRNTYNFAHGYDWQDGEKPDDLDPADPRRISLLSSYAQLRNYQISTECLLRRLYLWRPLTDFVRDIFGLPAIYLSQCPHLSLSLKIEGEGDIDNWHYDTNDGVVSILLSNADEGGDFEYVPYLKSVDDERHERAAQVLADPETHAIRRHAEPGDFTLFNGRLSLHRITPVGPTATPRVVALLCWDGEPDQVHEQNYIDYLDSLPVLSEVQSPSLERL